MSTLNDLKAAATAKLGSVHADVMTYISALEARVRANAVWILCGTVAGALLGYAIRSIVK